MDPNPFAALSLIVAPAILTNASSVLALSTSNRLARAVDRARELSRELERDPDGHDRVRVLRDLSVTETRALLLLRVLSSFYIALASFALAALASLIGAAVTSTGQQTLVNVFEGIGIAAGIVAVGALMHGAVLLVRETRLAVGVLQERAAAARAQR